MPMRLSAKRILAAVALVAAAAALLCYYWVVDPSSGPALPCPFKAATGWDCPGCGMQRALHAALHGHFTQAWGYNPFVLVAGPVAVFYIVLDIMRRRWPRLHRRANNPWLLSAILDAVLAWWVLRNVI